MALRLPCCMLPEALPGLCTRSDLWGRSQQILCPAPCRSKQRWIVAACAAQWEAVRVATARISALLEATEAAGEGGQAAHRFTIESTYSPTLLSVLGMIAFHCPELMILDSGIAALMRRTLDCQSTVRVCNGPPPLAGRLAVASWHGAPGQKPAAAQPRRRAGTSTDVAARLLHH